MRLVTAGNRGKIIRNFLVVTFSLLISLLLIYSLLFGLFVRALLTGNSNQMLQTSNLLIPPLTAVAYITKLLPDSSSPNDPYRVSAKNHVINMISLFSNFKSIVGFDRPKRYLILLQNNREIRPTGGFMGSYASVSFANGVLTDYYIQDIYVPDGQIAGHVDPPWPIQEAFGQGWWRLRDANWQTDFSLGAPQILWFFAKGNEKDIDGLTALNLSLVKPLLALTGPLALPDYQTVIDQSNYYEFLQSQVQTDFFPGSTQKRDVLSEVSRSLIKKLTTLRLKQKIKLVFLLHKQLNLGEVLVYFPTDNLNQMLTNLNWNAHIPALNSDPNIFDDYLYVVDSNLGSNKADCCITRNINRVITMPGKQVIEETLSLTYQNTYDPQSTDTKPFGGGYKNFVRLLIPKSAEIKSLTINSKAYTNRLWQQTSPDKQLQEVGFFLEVPPLETTQVQIVYSLPLTTKPSYYRVYLQKQPGVSSTGYNYQITTNNQMMLQGNGCLASTSLCQKSGVLDRSFSDRFKIIYGQLKTK